MSIRQGGNIIAAGLSNDIDCGTLPNQTVKLQILQGNTEQNNDFTGSIGELTMNTDSNLLRIHDGSNEGGYDVLGDANRTNCITEIPQDINLTLSNSTLTLKAGSKVYVPNGVGVFNLLTITNDITVTNTWGDLVQLLVYVKSDGSQLYIQDKSRGSSGSSAPTATNHQMWYDTTNNLIKHYNGGSDTGERYSFPIALCTKGSSTESANIASIDQVFNGFGYIGSTVFGLPGVKGLIANGRNVDGTLKNNKFTVNEVLTYTRTYSITGLGALILQANEIQLGDLASQYRYDEKANIFYYESNGDKRWMQFGVYYYSDNKVQSFMPNQTFNSVNYSNSGVVIDEMATLSDYSWYRKYSNGWVEQGGRVNVNPQTSVTLLVPMASSIYHRNLTIEGVADNFNVSSKVIEVSTNSTTLTIRGTFNNGLGANTNVYWEVDGIAAS